MCESWGTTQGPSCECCLSAVNRQITFIIRILILSISTPAVRVALRWVFSRSIKRMRPARSDNLRWKQKSSSSARMAEKLLKEKPVSSVSSIHMCAVILICRKRRRKLLLMAFTTPVTWQPETPMGITFFWGAAAI